MEEEILEEFKNFITSFTDCEKLYFLKQLRRNIDLAKCQGTPECLYKFVKSEAKLKLNEALIPSQVLPKTLKGSLHDVRIKTHGPDDKIYSRNKDFREKITRGLTFLELTRNNKPLPLDLVIYANKKFSGGPGDDDDYLPDSGDSWKQFFLEAPDGASSIVSCEKLNGEAGHFAGRFIEDEFYFFIGSKNVHLMVKSIDEIALYTDNRYSIARVVAVAVMTAVARLDLHCQSVLKTFLNRTKATFVCEVLQPEYQHIVNLSYLTEPVVKVVAVTSNACQTNDNKSLTAFSPNLTLEFCKLLGFTTSDYIIVDAANAQEEMNRIRQLENLEGNVMYYVDTNNNTIGLAKVKTYWYVLLRALREKAVHGFASRNPSDLSDIVKKTKKRFDEIQKWLKFDDSVLTKWKQMAELFLKWLEQRIKLNKWKASEIRPKYPIIWKSFHDTVNQ